MPDGTFSAEWLELREPADHRSRAGDLVRTLGLAGARAGWSRALDLGAGTGSNVRYLAPRLPFMREWTLLDHDADLLARVWVPSRLSVTRLKGRLDADGLDAVSTAHVVTASALLDLVSLSWLESLVPLCADARCAVLFALTYDGEISWSVPDTDDALIRDAVNEHQVRDKGLGAALGPRSASVTMELFRSAGYETRVRASDWELAGSGDAPLVLALIEGWVRAATETRPALEPRIRAWAHRRLTAVRNVRYGLRVGHRDLLALPPGSSSDSQRARVP